MSIQSEAQEALVRGVARELGALIPAPAVRSGWNVANLSVWYPADSTVPRWSVELRGPIAVDIDRHVYAGGKETRSLRVRQDIIETLETETPEELVRLVQAWVDALRLKAIKG